MTNKKPKIFLNTDISDIIDNALLEINHIINKLKKNQGYDQWVLKAIYMYGYSIYESTLYNTYYRFLCAFPERIKIKENIKFDENLYEKSLVIPYIEFVASKFAKQFGHGKISNLLKEYNEVSKIILNETDLTKCTLIPLLDEYKENRNSLAHHGQINGELNVQYVIRNLKLIRIFIEKIKDRILYKYSEYDKLNLIRKSWKYLFDNVLPFERCWIKKHDTLYVNKKYIDNVAGCLSSSERMILLFFLANYSDSICKDSLSIADINPISHLDSFSRNKIAYIIELFMKYPILLQ